MKNLRKVGVSIFFVCIAIIGIAQNSGQNNRDAYKDKMAAVKVGYLTEKLDLTEDEASKFWPVYNQEREEIKALKPEKKEKLESEEMSDEQLEKHIFEKFEIEQKKLNIQQAYVQKYIAILGVRKTAELYKAEQDFKREILAKLQKGQGQQGPPKK